MPKVSGERQRIETLIDQFETCGVPQQVGVDIIETCFRGRLGEELEKAVASHRRAARGHEHVARSERLLTMQLAQAA